MTLEKALEFTLIGTRNTSFAVKYKDGLHLVHVNRLLNKGNWQFRINVFQNYQLKNQVYCDTIDELKIVLTLEFLTPTNVGWYY